MSRRALVLLVVALGFQTAPLAPPARKLDAASNDVPPPVKPKVLLLIYDPKIESEGGKRVHELLGYNDPVKQSNDYAADLKETSGGFVDYQIVETKWLEEFPLKKDGFRYTFDALRDVMQKGAPHHDPDAFDYQAFIATNHLCERVEAGEIDEVWMQAMPYAGTWESTMVGDGAYGCNSDPVEGVRCKKLFVIMGFNYERGVGEMLEDYGHRTEAILSHVFGSWDPPASKEDIVKAHAWNRFTLHEKIAPGEAACGNVHFAPNSAGDYDWGNKTPVQSTCDDWLHWPKLTGAKRTVTCAEWGNGDIRLHHKWWLAHLPKVPGRTDGKLDNWWSYVADLNRWPESNGIGAAPPGAPSKQD
jgi:hypothetical protein